LVVAAPERLRAQLRGRSTGQLVAACARLRGHPSWELECRTTAVVLRALARRVLELDAEDRSHHQAITAIVRGWRPDLLAERGIGPITAAMVLCAWSHPGRCRSDAAFAMLAGAAPIPASSGQRVRYRLNRSGDRQLNRALHTIVLARCRFDPTTRAYLDRRRAQGKANREIKRCLTRYVAPPALPAPRTRTQPLTHDRSVPPAGIDRPQAVGRTCSSSASWLISPAG
jgi:transposase